MFSVGVAVHTWVRKANERLFVDNISPVIISSCGG